MDSPTHDNPDTLDLAARASAALNYFIRNPDRDLRYQPFFVSNLEADPPYLEHNEWDFGDVTGRFVEAIAFIRLMTGDRSGAEVEAGLKEFMLSLLDAKDGLLYRPESKYNSYPLASSGGRAGAYIWDQRVLNALLAWYATTADAEALRKMELLVAGLARIAVPSGEASFFPGECYLGPGRWLDMPMMWVPDGQLIDPLVRYYELTGDKAALNLARRLGRSVLDREPRVFAADGEMLRDAHNTHFHSRTSALIGLLTLARADGNDTLVSRVEKSYRWARSRGSSFGWMPEQLKTIRWSETCCVADMVNLAMLLAEAGLTRYWEDVERFVRNCLVESQVLSTDGFPRPWRKVKEKVPGSRSYDEVPERTVGGFVGSVFPNDRHFEADWQDGFGISGCCSPHGARGLYLAWSHIVTRAGRTVRVNLNLSADTPWAEVISWHPYEGKVEILIRDAERLEVRVPSWASKDKTQLTRNGKRIPLSWEGDYLCVGDVRKDDRIVLSYPTARSENVEAVAGQTYEVRWRGDTVVDLKPAGVRMPLYQRAAMDRDEAPRGTGRTYRAATPYHLL